MITIQRLGTCHAWRSTLSQNVKLSHSLPAGGARIHIDFHADRHFHDLWGFPGHFGSLLFNFFNRTDSALGDKLMRNEKFASEIFFKHALIPFDLCCTAKGIHVFVRHDVKPKTDQELQSRFA